MRATQQDADSFTRQAAYLWMMTCKVVAPGQEVCQSALRAGSLCAHAAYWLGFGIARFAASGVRTHMQGHEELGTCNISTQKRGVFRYLQAPVDRKLDRAEAVLGSLPW